MDPQVPNVPEVPKAEGAEQSRGTGGPERVVSTEQSRSTEPRVERDNHWVSILAMAIFVLFSLGVVAFLYYQNQQLKNMLANYQTPVVSPTPTATPDPTADWKTYTNTKYNYEFKYPSDFNLEKSTSGGYFQTKLNNRLIFYATNDQSSTITDYLVKTDKISQSANEGLSSLQVQSTKKTVINGLNCIQREEYLAAADITQINTYFKKGSVVVSIALTPTPGNTLSDDESIYQQILSTFKFTATTSSASPTPTSKACTQEAKVCPDGSSVGRIGPNCEFAPCP